MPTLADQIALPGAFTADFTVVRALLQKGRAYEQAVKLFEPYREVRQPDPQTREALRRILGRAVQVGVGILQGQKPANPVELLPSKLVTRDNVGQYQGWTSAR